MHVYKHGHPSPFLLYALHNAYISIQYGNAMRRRLLYNTGTARVTSDPAFKFSIDNRSTYTYIHLHLHATQQNDAYIFFIFRPMRQYPR